jgi:hypothetical protein
VTPTPVRLTKHATAQLRDRWPEYREAEFRDIARLVSADVQGARAEGRMATKCPRRFVRTGTTRRFDARKGDRPSSARFMWSGDDRRLYVVTRRKGELTPGGKRVDVDLVLTAWQTNGGVEHEDREGADSRDDQ